MALLNMLLQPVLYSGTTGAYKSNISTTIQVMLTKTISKYFLNQRYKYLSWRLQHNGLYIMSVGALLETTMSAGSTMAKITPTGI